MNKKLKSWLIAGGVFCGLLIPSLAVPLTMGHSSWYELKSWTFTSAPTQITLPSNTPSDDPAFIVQPNGIEHGDDVKIPTPDFTWKYVGTSYTDKVPNWFLLPKLDGNDYYAKFQIANGAEPISGYYPVEVIVGSNSVGCLIHVVE